MNTVPVSLRRLASEANYQQAKLNGGSIPLDEEIALLEYKHWKLIANRFPYDMVYAVHDMLIPKRVAATRTDITVEEWIELLDIIDELQNQYHVLFENFPSRRSIHSHYHVHLARYHDSRDKMEA